MPWLVWFLFASDFKGLGLIQGHSNRNFCGYSWLGQVLRILLFPLVTFHKSYTLNLIRIDQRFTDGRKFQHKLSIISFLVKNKSKIFHNTCDATFSL